MQTLQIENAAPRFTRTYRGFLRFCAAVEFTPEDHQRRIARMVLAHPESLALLPRGQGKSQLIAAICVHHLLSVPDAAIYVAAASRDQAAVIYEYARDFALHPAIGGSRRSGSILVRHLELRTRAGHLRVLASDAPKLHGLTPSLCVIDELHAFKDAGVYVALRTALLKRPGARMVTISTAGQGTESPLGQLRARALALPTVKRLRSRTEVFSRDFSMLEWAVPDDTDLDAHPEAMLRANPASWIGLDALKRQREALPDGPFRRYHLGQWVAREGALFGPTRWQRCAGEPIIDPRGEPIVIGVDMGANRSATGVAWVQWHGEQLHCRTVEIDAPEAASEVDALVDRLASAHRVREIAADPWHTAGALADGWARRGLVVVEVPQHDARMVPAFQQLTDLVNSERLVHGDDPALNAAVENSVQQQTRRGARIGKASDRLRNDVLIALTLAVHRATFKPQKARLVGWI
ncbi:MAG TPA: terminase large subunit [Solirubrobacteraceae bacterium]|jgi:phage terminase large subunit-like protein|nr:terminase large subunit [Solirubrobacteraceae bacterium]